MFEACYRRLLTPVARNRVTVMTFHQVLEGFDPMRPDEITADDFRHMMSWVSRNFHTVTLAQAMDAIADHRLPDRTLVITFDDGYRDNATVALPILKQFGLCATFFVASDYLDGGIMWNDCVIEAIRNAEGHAPDVSHLGLESPLLDGWPAKQRFAHALRDAVKHLPPDQRHAEVVGLSNGQSLPSNLMMSSSEVSDLHAAGMEVGGHTCSHPILANLSADQVEQEIVVNKARLQQLVDAPLRSFAYPNGKPDQDYDQRAMQALRKAGYDFAVTTCPGVVTAQSDRLQLPRYTPWRKSRTGFLGQLFKNYTQSDSVGCQS